MARGDGRPRSLARFIGREADVRELMRIVDGVRLVTLVGAPGCGKTRLGLEVCRRLADRIRRAWASSSSHRSGTGVWWHPP